MSEAFWYIETPAVFGRQFRGEPLRIRCRILPYVHYDVEYFPRRTAHQLDLFVRSALIV
jgi:hypothetical protein